MRSGGWPGGIRMRGHDVGLGGLRGVLRGVLRRGVLRRCGVVLESASGGAIGHGMCRWGVKAALGGCGERGGEDESGGGENGDDGDAEEGLEEVSDAVGRSRGGCRKAPLDGERDGERGRAGCQPGFDAGCGALPGHILLLIFSFLVTNTYCAWAES